jgi:hypothetical protein
MSEQLYRKTMQGGRVRYIPVVEPEEEIIDYKLSDEQSVTVAGTLGTTLLCIFERFLPPHKRVMRKIAAVEGAIYDLFESNSKEINHEVSQWVVDCWNKAVTLAAEIPGGKG